MQEFLELGEMTSEEVDTQYEQTLAAIDELEFMSTLNETEDSLS